MITVSKPECHAKVGCRIQGGPAQRDVGVFGKQSRADQRNLQRPLSIVWVHLIKGVGVH